MNINVMGDMRLKMFSELNNKELYYNKHKINFCNYFGFYEEDEEYYYQLKIIKNNKFIICISVSTRIFYDIIEHKFIKEFNTFDEMNDYLTKKILNNIMTKNQIRQKKLNMLNLEF